MGFLDNPIPRRRTAGPKPGDIVQTYPDGTAMIYVGIDAYGDPRYEFMDISGGSGGAGRAPVYGPSGGASVVSVEPVGYGYVRVTYSDGSSEITEDRSPSAQQQQTYLSPDAPSGYIPIRDVQGNVIDYKQDFNYQGAPARREFDITAGLGEGLPLWQYNEGVRRYDQTYGEDVRQFDVGQQFREDVQAEDTRRWDTARVD